MKNSRSIIRSLFTGLAGTVALFAAVLLPRPAGATTYYWDNNSDTAGFGTAGGIWDTPTPGPIPGWTTDASGASIPGSITTTTTDALNFGNDVTGLGAGTITLNDALLSGDITFASGSGAILLSGGTSLSLADTATITVDNNSDAIATSLDGASSSLIKAGAGELILSGVNTVAGTLLVNSGTLTLDGGAFNLGAKALRVAYYASDQAVFNLGNGSLTNAASDSIGTGANAVGVVTLNGGNFIKTAGNFYLGNGGSSQTNYGGFLMSGGYANFGGEFDLGYNGLGAATYANVSGGTLICNTYVTVGREGQGILDISGGTLLRPTTAANYFYMTRSAGSFAQLTIRGTGTLDLEDPIGLSYGHGNATANTGMVNLMTGGTLISRIGVKWDNTGGATGYFNFNGGTLQASGSSATFWTDPWTACYIYNGGAVIDSQDNDITISQPFSVPSGGGVTAITGGTGSDYLAPPVVSITGDGTGATAIAQLDANGTITNILISNPGVNYSSASVTLLGGGGAASGWTAAIGANATTGGLTKLGSGTLTLSGYNTYQGPTLVGDGTLAVSYANYPTASALTLSNNAALSADVSGGASTFATPSLTLGDNAALNLDYGMLGGNPFEPAISDSTINAGVVLTAGGTNIVINLSGSGFVPGQFPIIKYNGSIGGQGFAAFQIGTLPFGVSAGAKLVNNTTDHSIDLSIPEVNTITWNGTDANWDINTSINWKDPNPTTYKEYGTTNIYGDIVTFDDSLGDPAQTNINLTTTLRPTAVNVSSYGAPYTFSGSGKLSGSGYLNVNGYASLTLDTTNDYDGGSTLSGGTVLVGNDAALGIGPVVLAGAILSSDSAAPRTLNNPVSITVDPTFGTGPSSGMLTLGGPVDLGGVPRGFTMENTVALTGPTINGSVTKTGTGTLVVDNPDTLLTGANTVSAGILVLGNGAFTGAQNVADYLYETAVLEIGNGNVTNTTANNVGTGPDAVGVIKQSGGNYVTTGKFLFGNGANGNNYGAFLMSGGYAEIGGEFDLAYNGPGATTYVNLSGGMMICNSYVTVGREGAGTLDISGGTFTHPVTAANKVYLNRTAGSFAELTIRDTGTMDIEDAFGLRFANGSANTGTGIVNLMTGGTFVSKAGISHVSTAGGLALFNFNGGTLQASGSSATFWTDPWTACYIYNGGAVIDSQDNDITISQPFSVPSGGGVTAITGGTGSDYLAPPVVSITGDGTGATAIAQLDANGTITNILISNPGVNYSSASVTLLGGGGAASGWTVNFGVNATTGGLTKLGSGTLTLTGANTYAGATIVSAGTLVLGEAHAATGGLNVADDATLGLLSDAPGVTVHLASATLGTTTGAGLLAQFTGTTGNPTAPAGYITNLTLNGATSVSVLSSDIEAGTIPLFQYSVLNGAGSFTTGTLPPGVMGTITNDTTTKTISLVVSSYNPLVWTGANSSSWDINITTNWTLEGMVTVYQNGPSVVFDDTAVNGNVVITQAVSPASIGFSNNAVAYNVSTSGDGVLTGTAGLTKDGFGTVTLSGANNYTGPTIISNGTLQIGDGVTSGSLANSTEISVGTNGTLSYNNPDVFNNISYNISGTGTINKDGATVGWGGSNTFSGTINVLNDKLALSSLDSVDGQPNVNISSDGVVSLGAGFAGETAMIGNLNGAGAIDCAFSSATGIRTLQVSQNTDGVFSGRLSDGSSDRLLALIKSGPATLTLSGTNAFTGGTTVNDGALIFDGTTISNSLVTVNSGAAFGGQGTVAGVVSFSAGSTATNTAGAPLTVDTLDLAGDATMTVATVSPLSSGSYPLINYTTLTGGGQFTDLVVGGAGLSSGATATVDISNGIVSLNVVGGAPAPVTITTTVSGNQLVLDWPAGQGWQLQMQTNSLSIGLTTNWITVPDAVPPFTNTVNPADPAVFYRLKQ